MKAQKPVKKSANPKAIGMPSVKVNSRKTRGRFCDYTVARWRGHKMVGGAKLRQHVQDEHPKEWAEIQAKARQATETLVDEDFDDAKWQFAHGLYETPSGERFMVAIDYRTVKSLNTRREGHDGARGLPR